MSSRDGRSQLMVSKRNLLASNVYELGASPFSRRILSNGLQN